jgi:hypothetical protein
MVPMMMRKTLLMITGLHRSHLERGKDQEMSRRTMRSTKRSQLRLQGLRTEGSVLEDQRRIRLARKVVRPWCPRKSSFASWRKP